jgi:hypothetical protein
LCAPVLAYSLFNEVLGKRLFGIEVEHTKRSLEFGCHFTLMSAVELLLAIAGVTPLFQQATTFCGILRMGSLNIVPNYGLDNRDSIPNKGREFFL